MEHSRVELALGLCVKLALANVAYAARSQVDCLKLLVALTVTTPVVEPHTAYFTALVLVCHTVRSRFIPAATVPLPTGECRIVTLLHRRATLKIANS